MRDTKDSPRKNQIYFQHQNYNPAHCIRTTCESRCTQTVEQTEEQRLFFSLLSAHRSIHVKPLMFDGNEEKNEMKERRNRTRADTMRRVKQCTKKEKKNCAGWWSASRKCASQREKKSHFERRRRAHSEYRIICVSDLVIRYSIFNRGVDAHRKRRWALAISFISPLRFENCLEHKSRRADEINRFSILHKTLTWNEMKWNETRITYCREEEIERVKSNAIPHFPVSHQSSMAVRIPTFDTFFSPRNPRNAKRQSPKRKVHKDSIRLRHTPNG